MDYTIKLNANASTPVQTGYTLKAGDKGQRLHFKVEGITTTSSVQIAFLRPTGTSVVSTEVTNLGNGEYEYVFKGNEIEFPGIVCADLKFYETNRRESTASFVFAVTGDTINGIAGPTGAYSDQLEELTTELQNTLDAYTQAFGTVGVMRPRGNYNNSVPYVKFDLVFHNGFSWLCLNDTVGNAPTDGSPYWQKYNSADADMLDGLHANEIAYGENLLDNAWFTVNQREGKIAPYGTPLYADASLSNVIAISNSANPVVELTATYAKIRDITVGQESYLYTKASDVVDGYLSGTGVSYSFDRWMYYGNAKKNNDVLDVFVPAGYPYAFISQHIEQSLAANLTGKEVTYSILESDGTVLSGTHIFGENFVVSGTWGHGDVFYDTTNNWSVRIVVNPGKEAHIKALKLELGSVSTLDKDALPNYALELAKCQRYFRRITSLYGEMDANGSHEYGIPLSGMRVSPSVSVSSAVYFDGSTWVSARIDATETYPTSVRVRLGGSGAYAVCKCNIDLSADL